MGAKVSKLQLLQAQGYKRLRGSRLHPPLLPPKGYVPVCVGADGQRKKYFVHTDIFKKVEFSDLLQRSEEEYRFCNESVVRVLHEADEFEKMIMGMKVKPRNLFRARQAFIISHVAD